MTLETKSVVLHIFDYHKITFQIRASLDRLNITFHMGLISRK